MFRKLGKLGAAQVLLILMIAGGEIFFSAAAPVDLEIRVGRRVQKVRSRSHEGASYYRLKDLASLLGLQVRERGGILELHGPRGELQLTEGRKLVRLKEQYLLISQPVWRRSSGDWYVPQDFLTVALPSVLDSKLETVGDRSYRLERLDENSVVVELLNYPDHVSVIFIPSRRTPGRVSDFDRFLRVEFDRYQVIPQLPATRPEGVIVRQVRFDPSGVYGAFEIEKGRQYHHYRDHILNDPYRVVVDIYGPPAIAEKPETISPRGTVTAPPPPVTSKPAPTFDETDAPTFRRRYFHNRITIDPGHGGENWGVHPSDDLIEKKLTLQIAERLQAALESGPFRPVLTRSRDGNFSIEQRSAQANFNQSRAFVSIHMGGSPFKEVGGAVVYIQQPIDEPLGSSRLVPWSLGQQRYLNASRELAELLQQRLNRLFGSSNTVVEAPLAVLAPVAAPAVLIEAGYLTHPEDGRRLANPEFIQSLAEAVAESLEEFLE